MYYDDGFRFGRHSQFCEMYPKIIFLFQYLGEMSLAHSDTLYSIYSHAVVKNPRQPGQQHRDKRMRAEMTIIRIG